MLEAIPGGRAPCDSFGIRVTDEALIDAPLCPRDGAPLATRRQLEIDYRACGRCGGLWFARNDLQRFELRSPKAAVPPAESTAEPRSASVSGPARCICRQQPVMIESERRGVTIDICPSCRGIWLDAGEIDEILQCYSASDLTSRLPYRPNAALQAGDLADGAWALDLAGGGFACLLDFLAGA